MDRKPVTKNQMNNKCLTTEKQLVLTGIAFARCRSTDFGSRENLWTQKAVLVQPSKKYFLDSEEFKIINAFKILCIVQNSLLK